MLKYTLKVSWFFVSHSCKFLLLLCWKNCICNIGHCLFVVIKYHLQSDAIFISRSLTIALLWHRLEFFNFQTCYSFTFTLKWFFCVCCSCIWNYNSIPYASFHLNWCFNRTAVKNNFVNVIWEQWMNKIDKKSLTIVHKISCFNHK